MKTVAKVKAQLVLKYWSRVSVKNSFHSETLYNSAGVHLPLHQKAL